MRSYFIETWGCQMNHHDSEHLEGQLRGQALVPADNAAVADLVLLNTCSVREKPVHKIVSRIGELAIRDPLPIIGVCGCVAQQEGHALLKRSRAVRFVLGPGQNRRLAEALRLVEQGERPVLVGFDAEAEYNFGAIFRTSETRGMVTVVEGCNEFCTFCVVPYTRGREVSRPSDEILDEVRSLSAHGLREVELLGQTINAYRCPQTGIGFATLLDRIADVAALERVRFITSHPRHFDDALIRVLANRSKVSRYLHLPFQSGSDAILKRMNRKYACHEYLDLIDRIRAAVPDITLSTDVIVGFPGETESDFEATLEVVEQVRFGQVFGFAYSPRPKTPARRYEHQLPEQAKKERLQRLFATADRISSEINQQLVGRVMRVLVDGQSRKRSEEWQGRAADNRVVNFPREGVVGLGDLVDVEITAAGPHSLRGRVLVRADQRLPVVTARGA